MAIVPSKDSLEISQPETPQEKKLWIVDSLTVLAEAIGEPVTAERLQIYAEDLSDLDTRQLTVAFGRARREHGPLYRGRASARTGLVPWPSPLT